MAEVKEKHRKRPESTPTPSLHSGRNWQRTAERGGVQEGEVREGGDNSVPLGVGGAGIGTEIGKRPGRSRVSRLKGGWTSVGGSGSHWTRKGIPPLGGECVLGRRTWRWI